MKWNDILRSPYRSKSEQDAARAVYEQKVKAQREQQAAERTAKGWPEGAYTQKMADLMNVQAEERAALKAQLDATREARAWNAATTEYLETAPTLPRDQAN